MSDRANRAGAFVAVLLLAPAIGLNVALVDLVSRLMFFQAPGVEDVRNLVFIGGLWGTDIAQFQAEARTLEVAATVQGEQDIDLGLGSAPALVKCATPNYFSVLGLRPLAGRHFDSSMVKQNPLVAVISERLAHRLSSDSDGAVVGRHLVFRSRPFSVVGVAPRAFVGLDGRPVDVWIPLTPGGEDCSPTQAVGSPTLNGLGRLRGGYSVQQAASEWRAFGGGPPDANRTVVAFSSSRRVALHLDGELLAWVVAGGLLALTLAAINAAALFSMMTTERRREIAIRHSLGATPAQVAWLLTKTSLRTVSVSACAAWATAQWFTTVLGRFYDLRSPAAISTPVWVSAGAISFLACAGYVLVLSAAASRHSARSLRLGALGARVVRRRGNAVTLVTQVGFGFAALVLAALFWHSVGNATSSLGYDLDDTVAVTVDPRRSVYDADSALQPMRDALCQLLRKHPGVASVASVASLPLMGASFVGIRADVPTGARSAAINVVTPEYLQVVRAPLIDGRDLSADDMFGRPQVAIVSDEMARKVWGTSHGVGRCVYIKSNADCTRVVGVYRAMRARFFDQPLAEFVVPLAQAPSYSLSFVGRSLIMKTATASKAVEAVRDAARIAIPGVPLDVAPLSAAVDPYTRRWRLGATAFGVVGALTFVLAVVGVFCSLSLSIRQRTAEIGIRVALGASRGAVLWLILKDGMFVLTAGWILGTGLALAAARLTRGLMFGIAGLDFATFAVSTATIFISAAAACLLPSWRATRIDPLRAIRMECTDSLW